MKLIDRVFGFLLFLGGCGHALGAFSAYSNDQMGLLWALSASFAEFLLAAINLLRAWRRHDRPLAWICLVGCLIWIGFVLRFGVLVGSFFDFRVVINLIITLALAGFSARSIWGTPAH